MLVLDNPEMVCAWVEASSLKNKDEYTVTTSRLCFIFSVDGLGKMKAEKNNECAGLRIGLLDES